MTIKMSINSNTEKQLNGLRKSIPDMNGKFNKEIERLKRSQTEILQMKDIINQIKHSTESLSNRVDHAEDGISELKDKVASLEYSDSIKEKKISDHDQNIQEL